LKVIRSQENVMIYLAINGRDAWRKA